MTDVMQVDEPITVEQPVAVLDENETVTEVDCGLEGPNSEYVKLISSDEHEFIIKREHALLSGTIKAMLSGPGQFAEHESNEIHFKEISSHVLYTVSIYLAYKHYYKNTTVEIPVFPMEPEIALELLLAANFLDC